MTDSLAGSKQDRKKSAHWTEADTSILINVLLRHKDSGRTQDNGFKPEVWREAAECVKGTTMSGGPKTPDACKSRWQRLQRDFKAVKELELVPGFTFDRATNKLSASKESWAAAEKTYEASKCSKIHLPNYDALMTLCPVDMNALRLRSRSNRPRTSMGAMSDTPSLLSTMSSAPSGNPQTPQMGVTSMLGTPTGMMGHVGMSMGLGDGMIHWDGGEIETEQDFEGSFTMPDGQIITMSRAQKRMSTAFGSNLSSNAQNHADTDGGMMLDQRGSPAKKQKTSSTHHPSRHSAMSSQQIMYGMHVAAPPAHSPEYSMSGHLQGLSNPGVPCLLSPSHNAASASLQAVTGHQAQQVHPAMQPQHQDPQLNHHVPHMHQPQQPTQPQHHQHQHQHQNPTHPRNHPHLHIDPHQEAPGHQLQQGQDHGNHHVAIQRKEHSLHHPQQHHPRQQQQQQQQQPQPHSQHQHQPQDNASMLQKNDGPAGYAPPSHPPSNRPSPPAAQSQRHSPILPDSASDYSGQVPNSAPAALSALPEAITRVTTPTPLGSGTSTALVGGTPAKDVSALSESQRRTDAIWQLQTRETDMVDEDMVEVLEEFESNVAAADTYLAIQREGLRRRYLHKIVKRRKGG